MCKLSASDNKVGFLGSFSSHMSKNSEDTNLNETKTENTAKRSGVDETGKKLKSNYCYVCKVQCTAPKNFREHKKGRKHLKNLKSSSGLSEKRKNQKKERKPRNHHKKVKNIATSKEFLPLDCNNSVKVESNVDNSNIPAAELTNETMNNPHKRSVYDYRSADFNNQYSRFNSPMSYSNDYRNGRPYYDAPNNFRRWNPAFPNFSRLPNAGNPSFAFRPRTLFQNPNSRYNNFAPENRHFSENRPAFFNSYGNYAESSVDFDYSTVNFDYSDYNAETSGSPQTAPFRLNMSSSDENCEKLNPREVSSSSIGSCNGGSTKVQTTDIAAESEAGSSKQTVSKIIYSKFGAKMRIRSRSLSLSESGTKDKNENQVGSDAVEEERLKEWTSSLLEIPNNKISRLVNPSNYKEKAVLAHLMTKLSKSKRKEILTTTLRSNSSESLQNNEDDDVSIEEVNKDVESLDYISEAVSVILKNRENQSSSTELEVNSLTASKNKNKYLENSNVGEDSVEPAATEKSPLNLGSRKPNKKNKDTISTSSPVTAEKRRQRNLSDTYQEKYKKRKSLDSDTGIDKRLKIDSTSYIERPVTGKATKLRNASESCEKKRKTNSFDSSERPSTSKASESRGVGESSTFSENSSNFSRNTKTPNVSSSDILAELKKEVMDHCEEDLHVPATAGSSESMVNQDFPFNSEISVDTLIQLFASGTVKVKEEFNDPVMDALKGMNPDELINACTSEFVNISDIANKNASDSRSKRNSKDKSTSEIPAEKDTSCLEPVIMGAAVIGKTIDPVSETQRSSPSLQNLPASDDVSENICIPSTDQNKNSNDSVLDMNDTNLIKSQSELPSHIQNLIKQLQEIASQEEIMKQNLTEAKSKISEYSALLDEWKNKKKKLQEEEENLRKQRNDIIKTMQDAVEVKKDDDVEVPTSLSGKDPSVNHPTSSENQKSDDRTLMEDASRKLQTPSPLPHPPIDKQKATKNESPDSSESDDITILPSPKKPCPPEIIICDDGTSVSASRSGNSKSSRNEDNALLSAELVHATAKCFATSKLSSLPGKQPNEKTSRNVKTTTLPDKSPRYEAKSISAHSAIVNCLVVFEDFLYTCSNDSTAKRFNLKDSSLTATYLHSAKNVLEIVVERVQNEALVLTSCSTSNVRVISLFIAASGTKIKTFFPRVAVMSICRGWGKFYSGLANGTVNVYNWKYEEIEIVKTEQPVSRIATAFQGRLHVLVILSSEGNISIRDAETGLLIRYLKIYIKLPSWMCLHSDLVYLSSSDKTLIILDIMSGREEKRLYLNNHATGLAVYDDYVFTISCSGIINCYNKDKSCDKKLFYGAGKTSLSCVHVFQDWVFTGNRKGEVSLFRFDPCSSVVCEYNKCDIVYGLKEDLEFHVEKDHIKKKNVLRCCWRGCCFTFPRNADIVDKMNHVKTHIHEIYL